METLKTALRPFALVLMLALPLLTLAGPGSRHRDHLTSVGFRAGWSGGPNGLTVRTAVNEFSAFEFVAGINNKAMRRSEIHNGFWQFDTYLGASYQPSFMMGDYDLSVGFYGDFGVRARIHNYRFHYGEANPITPDFIGGAGMMIQTNSIQLFADLHAKYSDMGNGTLTPGLESGLGLRILL